MKITFDNSDFEKFQNHIERLDRELQNTSDIVPFSEIITDSFIRKCSDFSSLDELLDAGGFNVNSHEDLEAITDAELDSHISKVTTFNNWDELLGTAVDEYTVSKLGL